MHFCGLNCLLWDSNNSNQSTIIPIFLCTILENVHFYLTFSFFLSPKKKKKRKRK